MNRLRTGVIGCGVMGYNHARIYRRLSTEHDFVGVFDVDVERAKEVATTFGTHAFTSLSEMLMEVDAVTVAVPTKYHFETCMQCFDEGVHVLVEKPITLNLREAEILIRRAEVEKLVLQVGHVERYNPVFTIMSKIVEPKSVIAVDMRRLSPYDSRIQDVDVVQDLMIHDIDLLVNLLGEFPEEIHAIGSAVYSEYFADHVVAQMKFPSGIVGTITASRVTEEKIRSTYVTCKEKFINADLLERKLDISRSTHAAFSADGEYRQQSIIEKVFVPSVEPLLSEVTSFLDAVYRGDLRVEVTAYQGMKALELTTMIQDRIYRA